MLWDASVSATLPLGGGMELRPSLAVDNLADARYVDPMSRFRPYGVPAQGRSVRVRVALGF